MHMKDNSGEAATIKYGLIAVGIAIAIIVGVQLTGTAPQPTFTGLPTLQ